MQATRNPFGTSLAQVAWVVPDIAAAERFFQESLGVPPFRRMSVRAQDVEGTYYDQPGDYEFELSLAYSNGWMLELIQPLAGHSIYKDFLDRHPAGGVHHVACAVPEAQFEHTVELLAARGHHVVQAMRLPVARVAYLDVSTELGVLAEVIGVTPAGFDLLEQLKQDAA